MFTGIMIVALVQRFGFNNKTSTKPPKPNGED